MPQASLVRLRAGSLCVREYVPTACVERPLSRAAEGSQICDFVLRRQVGEHWGSLPGDWGQVPCPWPRDVLIPRYWYPSRLIVLPLLGTPQVHHGPAVAVTGLPVLGSSPCRCVPAVDMPIYLAFTEQALPQGLSFRCSGTISALCRWNCFSGWHHPQLSLSTKLWGMWELPRSSQCAIQVQMSLHEKWS